MGRQYTFTKPVSGLRVEKIKDLLRKEPMTSIQISGEIYLSPRWTREYLKHMKDQGLVHIVDWRRYSQGGEVAAIYTLGPGEDAPLPIPKDDVTKQREYRARLKKDPVRRDLLLAAKRARNRKPKRDDFVSALFGRAA